MNGKNDFGEVSHNLRQKLNKILGELRKEFFADVVTLFLYDAETDQFDFPIGIGLHDIETFEDPRMRPRRGRTAQKIVMQKTPIIAENVRGHPDMEGAFTHREGIESTAGYPLIYNNTLIS